MKLKLVTWNINKASYKRKELWRFLEELDFDIGLFQETYIFPYSVRKNYHTVRGEMNIILSKKDITTNIIQEDILNTTKHKDLIVDLCLSCRVKIIGNELIVLSVYNYPGPTVEDFKEFLNVLYEYLENNKDKTIIIGGDFSMDEKFQKQLKRWGKVAKEMKIELSKLGYIEVLSEKSKEAFTFIVRKNGKKYQLDYLFIPREIPLIDVRVSDEKDITKSNSSLSDHLSIIVTIDL